MNLHLSLKLKFVNKTSVVAIGKADFFLVIKQLLLSTWSFQSEVL